MVKWSGYLCVQNTVLDKVIVRNIIFAVFIIYVFFYSLIIFIIVRPTKSSVLRIPLNNS